VGQWTAPSGNICIRELYKNIRHTRKGRSGGFKQRLSHCVWILSERPRVFTLWLIKVSITEGNKLTFNSQCQSDSEDRVERNRFRIAKGKHLMKTHVCLAEARLRKGSKEPDPCGPFYLHQPYMKHHESVDQSGDFRRVPTFLKRMSK
jgi:hypothetical protein